MEMKSNLYAIEYFKFEADFVEANVRCIPMIVRFKLDACGVKLKLAEWSKMNSKEREELAIMPCDTTEEIIRYREHLQHIIWQCTGQGATPLPILKNPPWAILSHIPDLLQARLQEFGWIISLQQWRHLSLLQRFALVKLCTANHEHKNFAKAIKEFNLA